MECEGTDDPSKRSATVTANGSPDPFAGRAYGRALLRTASARALSPNRHPRTEARWRQRSESSSLVSDQTFKWNALILLRFLSTCYLLSPSVVVLPFWRLRQSNHITT